jgi:adenosylcobyric acid synthase
LFQGQSSAMVKSMDLPCSLPANGAGDWPTTKQGGAEVAKYLMLQGVASNVGKSLLAAGLCRLFHQEGYKVAPFKAWNMALNSYMTPTGEIGRSQGIQAEAAGVLPTADMNPLLIKPTGAGESQVVVQGRVREDLKLGEPLAEAAMPIVQESLERLSREYELIIMEGAGSPVEINLRHRDVANMGTALMVQAPVMLVADIDRGGALAALVGTMRLFRPKERALVGGFILNKFRGDAEILQPALTILEERGGRPVLGVVPYRHDLLIDEEDSLGLERISRGPGAINIGVFCLPYMSNYTDFTSLAREEGVAVHYIDRKEDLSPFDALIIPDTENLREGLEFLETQGYRAQMALLIQAGVPAIGIGRGFIMLGQGHLGLLPLQIESRSPGQARAVRVQVAAKEGWLGRISGSQVQGYLVHEARTEGAARAFTLDGEPEGIQLGSILGTSLHGLFEDGRLRRAFINYLRERKNLPPLTGPILQGGQLRQEAYDRLAEQLRESLDIPAILDLVERSGRG